MNVTHRIGQRDTHEREGVDFSHSQGWRKDLDYYEYGGEARLFAKASRNARAVSVRFPDRDNCRTGLGAVFYLDTLRVEVRELMA